MQGLRAPLGAILIQGGPAATWCSKVLWHELIFILNIIFKVTQKLFFRSYTGFGRPAASSCSNIDHAQGHDGTT